MAAAKSPEGDSCETNTLGALLDTRKTAAPVSEVAWVGLIRAVAAGNQQALQALHERMHRVVFTLTVRITGSRETAEEVTVDVFYDVWRRAATYDPRGGTVVGWIMNQARSRAIDRVRFEHRKKRVNPYGDEQLSPVVPSGPPDDLQRDEQDRLLHDALTVLTEAERRAIESAFLAEMSHSEVAARLNEPLGTVKTRLRSGLKKLRQKLTGEDEP